MTMPPIESLTEARDRLNAIAGSGTVPSPADAQQLRDLVDDAIAGLEPPTDADPSTEQISTGGTDASS